MPVLSKYIFVLQRFVLKLFKANGIRYLTCILCLLTPIFSTASSLRKALELDVSNPPALLKADKMVYDAVNDVFYANGNIFASFGTYTLTARDLYYDVQQDELSVAGDVKITDETGRIIIAERAMVKDQFKQAILTQMAIKMPQNAILVAAYATKFGQNQFSLHKATFTPCSVNCNRTPIWQIRAAKTDVDYNKSQIFYKHVFFELFGVPVVYLPVFFHPTPNAPAQSGILTPQLKNKGLLIPIYLRAKSNLDLTISPRIADKYNLFEGELRHLTTHGSYEATGSYARINQFQNSKTTDKNNYHIFAKGHFNSADGIQYGFDINRASNKAYLTNYFEFYDSYLESRAYVNKINKFDYFSLEGYSISGLRQEDKKINSIYVLPRNRVQKIINLDDDETVFLKAKNEALIYRENDRQIGRNALEVGIENNFFSDYGYYLHNSISNRADLYWLSFTKRNGVVDTDKDQVWTRNLPEISSAWRYPILGNVKDLGIKFEPVVLAVLGKNYDKRQGKFGFIDATKYELSEYNIFDANRFSGVDYHDFGQRLSYGISTSLFQESYYTDLFIGQLVYKNNLLPNANKNYIGSASFDADDQMKIYYRFQKDDALKPIRDEIILASTIGKLSVESDFITMHALSKHYSVNLNNFPANKVSQFGFNTAYQLTEDLKLGFGSRLDVTNKSRLINRTIKVTYSFDCVTINAKIYDDFTYDKSRGVKKTSNKTFSIGLKILNM